jgi:hypothetical protein
MSQPEMKVHPDGTKEWYLNDKRHREDGPAVERPNGSNFWYLNDVKVTWQEVFRQAKNPEIELRILITAFTTS